MRNAINGMYMSGAFTSSFGGTASAWLYLIVQSCQSANSIILTFDQCFRLDGWTTYSIEIRKENDCELLGHVVGVDGKVIAQLGYGEPAVDLKDETNEKMANSTLIVIIINKKDLKLTF